jgi:hypothetical protein
MEKVDAGRFWVSDPHGSARGAPAEVLRGLRRSGGLPAVRKRGGGSSHRRRYLVQFRSLHGPGSRMKASGSFLAPRRS